MAIQMGGKVNAAAKADKPAKATVTTETKDSSSGQVVASDAEEIEVPVPGAVQAGTSDRWAMVEVALGRTIGLENYSSFRVDVRLKIPVPADELSLDQGFGFAHEWCKEKVKEMSEGKG